MKYKFSTSDDREQIEIVYLKTKCVFLNFLFGKPYSFCFELTWPQWKLFLKFLKSQRTIKKSLKLRQCRYAYYFDNKTKLISHLIRDLNEVEKKIQELQEPIGLREKKKCLEKLKHLKRYRKFLLEDIASIKKYGVVNHFVLQLAGARIFLTAKQFLCLQRLCLSLTRR